jgi:hypothetical protein
LAHGFGQQLARGEYLARHFFLGFLDGRFLAGLKQNLLPSFYGGRVVFDHADEGQHLGVAFACEVVAVLVVRYALKVAAFPGVGVHVSAVYRAVQIGTADGDERQAAAGLLRGDGQEVFVVAEGFVVFQVVGLLGVTEPAKGINY